MGRQTDRDIEKRGGDREIEKERRGYRERRKKERRGD